MFYAPPIDHELLDRMPAAGGADGLPDLLSVLARDGGAGSLPDLLSVLARAGGAGALPDLLSVLARDGGSGALPDLLARLARVGGADALPDLLAVLARDGGSGSLPDLLSVLADAGRSDCEQHWIWTPYQGVSVSAWQRLTVLERPEPALDVYVEQRSAEFLLEGYPEYEGYESTPPRFYRREEYGGTLARYAWPHTTGLDTHTLEATRWTGEVIWPALKGSSGVEVRFSDWVGADAGSVAEDDPRWDDPDETTSVPTIDLTDTWVFLGWAPGTQDLLFSTTLANGSDIQRVDGVEAEQIFEISPTLHRTSTTYGYLEKRLTHEHTPCDALAEAVAGAGWEPVFSTDLAATTVSWLADPSEPRRWEGTESRWHVLAHDLVPGESYRLRWLRSGLVQEVVFTATEPHWDHEEKVPCGAADSEWVIEFVEPFDFALAKAIYNAMGEAGKGPVVPLDGEEAESFFAWSPAWLGAEYADKWVIAEGWLEVAISGLAIGQDARLRWQAEAGGVTRNRAQVFAIDADPHVIEMPVAWEKPNERMVGRVLAVDIQTYIGDDMGLDNLATSGGAPCSTPERLAGLATQGGRLDLPPDLLSALGDAGGRAADGPWHVILALLPYQCIDWGPWVDRWGCEPEIPLGALTLEDIPLTLGGAFLTYYTED